MATYYLKATDEQALWEALEAAGLAEKEYDMSDPNNVRPANQTLHDSDDHVEIGYYRRMGMEINTSVRYYWDRFRETGNMLTDAEGNQYPENEAMEGYHANLRAELTAEQDVLLPTIEAPTTPNEFGQEMNNGKQSEQT